MQSRQGAVARDQTGRGANRARTGRPWVRGLAVARALGAALLSAVVVAACSAAPNGPATRPIAPAIWRLADSDSEIWLFGTVHVLPPGLEWRSPTVEKAFAGAETVVFETPTDAAAQAEVGRVVAETGSLAADAPLSSRLSAADSARLKRVIAKLGLAPAGLERVRPWLAALQLSLRFAATKGQAAENGVERVLDGEARARRVPIRYLETPESQIRLLAELPPADELRFLTATLRQIDEDSDTSDAMDDAWLHGDVETLAALLTEDISEAGPEVYARLLTRRNARWTEEIESMMRGKGRIFIAVGAAHLVGPDSVPALLRARGYVVEGPDAAPAKGRRGASGAPPSPHR